MCTTFSCHPCSLIFSIYTYLNSQPFSLQDARSQLLAEKANLQSKLDEAQKELESLQVRLNYILRFMFYSVYMSK